MASLTEPLDPEILSAVHTTLSQLQGQLDRISYHALNTAIRGLVELIIIVIRGPISNDELKMLNVQLEELLDVTTTIVEDLVIGHRPETLSSDIQGVHESCSRLLLRHRRSGSLIYVEGSPVATLIEGINKAVSSFRHPSSLLQEPLMPQNPPLPSNMRWRHDLASGVDLGNVCVSAIAISPDGERIATASWDNTLCLWDTRTGGQIARSATHSGEVSIVCFSQNGGFITSGSYNGTLRVWLSPNVQLALIPGPILKGHSDSISALTVTGISSNEPELIVSGSWDNTIRVWRADGDHVATLEGHDDIISSVSVSEHGEFFISSSWDKTIGVWDGRDYTLLTKVSVEATQEVVSVAYLLDGSIISGHKDDVVRQWSLLTMEMMTEQDGKLGSARQFSFTGDFSRAMSIGDNHTSSQIWGIASTSTSTILTPRLINLENPSTCECSSVAISKDGTFSVLGYSDGSIERISMEGVVDRNDSPAQETQSSSSSGSTPTILHEPFQLLSQLDEKSYDVKYFVQQVLRALRDSRAFVTQLNAEFQALHNSFDPGALDRLVELAGDAVELKRRLILMELIVQTTSADPNFYVLTSNMLTMHELVHWVHQRPYYKEVHADWAQRYLDATRFDIDKLVEHLFKAIPVEENSKTEPSAALSAWYQQPPNRAKVFEMLTEAFNTFRWSQEPTDLKRAILLETVIYLKSAILDDFLQLLDMSKIRRILDSVTQYIKDASEPSLARQRVEDIHGKWEDCITRGNISLWNVLSSVEVFDIITEGKMRPRFRPW